MLHPVSNPPNPWASSETVYLDEVPEAKFTVYEDHTREIIAKNDSHMFVRLLQLSAVFMLMTLLVFALYGVFASSMRAYVLGRSQVTTWLRRAFALGFVGLSLKLVL